MALNNPYIETLFVALVQQHHWKLNALSALLNEQLDLPELDVDPTQHLFKHNFLLMNALFTLQDELKHLNSDLIIDSIDITYIPMNHDMPTTYRQPLREYYLDWRNYSTETEEIEQLLADFWQRYCHNHHFTDVQISQALARFELPTTVTYAQIKKRWRELAITFHPDKQHGNTELFQQLQEDWCVLKLKYKV